ncbi:hypothetical protein ACF3M1_05685 [Luteimonas sp. WGS1318]|uniref:hypothetical protein n=1 Tax=Luteimonas sp. WGS1318 TaxID=3366815 RepID=UPI00372D6639
MSRRAVLVLSALILALGAGAAQADGLSGTYRPAGDAGTMPAGAQLTVRAEGRGWLAMFQGEGLALLPLAGFEQAGLFPGVPAGAGLQCASSAAFVLCRVAPGTELPDKGFTSRTGWFMAFSDRQIFDMERVD